MDAKLTIAALMFILAGVIMGLALPLLVWADDWMAVFLGPVTVFAQVWLIAAGAFVFASALVVWAAFLLFQWREADSHYAEAVSKDEMLRLTQRDDPRTDSIKRRQTADRRGE